MICWSSDRTTGSISARLASSSTIYQRTSPKRKACGSSEMTSCCSCLCWIPAECRRYPAPNHRLPPRHSPPRHFNESRTQFLQTPHIHAPASRRWLVGYICSRYAPSSRLARRARIALRHVHDLGDGPPEPRDRRPGALMGKRDRCCWPLRTVAMPVASHGCGERCAELVHSRRTEASDQTLEPVPTQQRQVVEGRDALTVEPVLKAETHRGRDVPDRRRERGDEYRVQLAASEIAMHHDRGARPVQICQPDIPTAWRATSQGRWPPNPAG